jgi:hypothetical protein
MADIKNTQVMNVSPNVDINYLNAQQKVECTSEIHKQKGAPVNSDEIN